MSIVEKNMSIANLDIYQLIEIFEFLNLKERFICSKVCKEWRDAIKYLGIQQLTIYYFKSLESNMLFNNSNDLDVIDKQELNKRNQSNIDQSINQQTREDKRFVTYIQTDKLLEQLGNSLFRKLRVLKIYANSSLQLADSYINLKQLKSLESLQIDNRSLTLCLNMCLERDKINLTNLKYLNIHRIDLKILLKHFPNLIKIKCVQIECSTRLRLEDFYDQESSKKEASLDQLIEEQKNKLNQLKQLTNEFESNLLNQLFNVQKIDLNQESKNQGTKNQDYELNKRPKIKWLYFEQNSVVEINNFFFEFLIENCALIEGLKINLKMLEEAILLIKSLKNLKRLKFNCKTNESLEFREKLIELIRLVNSLNQSGQNLNVQFNGLELLKCNCSHSQNHNTQNHNNLNPSSVHYHNYDSQQLKKYMITKSEFNTLNYFDLMKIDQMNRNSDLSQDDLESLFKWSQVIHINQNLYSLRFLSIDNLIFINVKQLFFKAFDYDHKVNDQQLKLLFNKLPNLQSIDLSYAHRLDQASLDYIPNNWPKLKELNLSSNLGKSIICLKFISKLCNLERAEFYRCRFNRSTFLDELIQNLKYFNYLSINDCDQVMNIDKIYEHLYLKSTRYPKMEYNLFMDKSYSQIINQKFNDDKKFPLRRNFFFID